MAPQTTFHFLSPLSLTQTVVLAVVVVALFGLARVVFGLPLGPARRPGLWVLRGLILAVLVAILANPVQVDRSPGRIERFGVTYLLDTSASMALGESTSRLAQAIRHPIWNIVSDAKRNETILASLPAFTTFHRGLSAKQTAQVLALGRLDGASGGSSVPLLAAGPYGKGRTMAAAVSLGPQWSPEFASRWGESDNRYYGKLWRNAVYWLTENSYLGRRRLVVASDKASYQPGDAIKLTARAFDETSNPTTDCRVTVTVQPQSLDADPVEFSKNDGEFAAEVKISPGGWYVCRTRATGKGQLLATAEIPHVGVGEVFVVAGQSNSANHGEEQQNTQTGLVAAFAGTRWQLAHDPQPGASGGGGSFLPPLGDAIAERCKVPVGIVACGIGATSVREWLPQGAKFPNPPTLVGRIQQLPSGEWESKGEAFAMFTARMKQLGPHGFRAVLWHQGESDANQKDPTRTLPGSLYRQYLEQLIRDSRREIGWEAPWFVAQVSNRFKERTKR